MKKSTIVSILCLFTCFSALIFAGPVQSSTTYELGYVFSGATPSGSSPWITATFDETYGGPNTVRLTMSAVNLPETGKIKEWYFNFDDTLDLSKLSFSYVDDEDNADGNEATVSKNANAFKADGDGFFDILFSFPTDGSENTFFVGEHAIYDISYISPISDDSFNFENFESKNGSFYSAAHVLAINPAKDSSWIGTPVPIPPTFLLFGSFLVGFGGLRIKLRKS